MNNRTPQTCSSAVQIIAPTYGIMERLSRKLPSKLPYAALTGSVRLESPALAEPPGGASHASARAIAYYMDQSLYHGPSGLIDVGCFSHLGEANQLDESNHLLERARSMDFCVCTSRKQ